MVEAGGVHTGDGTVGEVRCVDDAPAAVVEEEDGDVYVFERLDTARQVAIGENKGVGYTALHHAGYTGGLSVNIGIDFSGDVVEINGCAPRELCPLVESARRIDGESSSRIIIGLQRRTDAVFEHNIGEAQV